MSGKALLILVLGFTLIFLVVGYFWSDMATRSTENHVSYYKSTIAHNIAVSGANIGLQKIIYNYQSKGKLLNGNLVTEIFEHGVMTVDFDSSGTIKPLTSTGTFMGTNQIVKVKLMEDQTSLAKYAWFIPSVSTGSVNRPWITGDTVWGGFHSNQFLVVEGDPVFMGKVTTLKGIKDQAKLPYVSNPQFFGGYQDGIDVSWTSSMHYPDYAALANPVYSSLVGKDLWLTFNSTGTVTYRTRTGNGGTDPGQDSTKYGAPVTVDLTTFAGPNGVIYNKNANIYISGTLSGKVTIVSEGSSGVGSGNVYFEGDMVYTEPPMIPYINSDGLKDYKVNPLALDSNGDPKDLLGIIATNNVIVSTSGNLGGYTNNVADKNINVDGSIFCNSGGFEADNLSSLPPLENINFQGSMTAGMEDMVAQFSGNTLIHGYNRHVVFDTRLNNGAPQWFPYLDYYKVVSWLE